MDKAKAKRNKMFICEIMEDVEKEDFGKTAVTEHLKNLAKLYDFYERECKEAEYGESSMRGMSMGYAPGAYRTDGQEWGAWADAPMRSERRYPMAYGYSMSGGNAKEAVRRIMDDPNISREDREALKRAMDQMR